MVVAARRSGPATDCEKAAATARRGCRFQSHPLSSVQMATETVAPLVLRAMRLSRIFCRWMRRVLEYVQHGWALSRLWTSMALDSVFALCRLVAARGLVRKRNKKTVSRRTKKFSLGSK
jgi:hypothetical protein